MALDKDLASIQEARELVVKAHEAWKSWSHVSPVSYTHLKLPTIYSV